MKLSKTSRLFLAIGILVIAAVSLGVAYSHQGREQSRLNQELSQAQLRLEKYLPQQLSSREEELESQLAQAKSKLEAAKVSLSQSTESIEASDALFEIAEACDVEITEISSSPPTSQKLEGDTYSVLSLAVKLEGDVPNLINFILKLGKKFPTSVVKSAGISVPETTDREGQESEEETGEELKKSSANLRLLIYTYRGD